MLISLNSVNRSLKNYDSRLYAVTHKENRIDVYRKADFSLSPPHYLFSLTEDWTVNTRPVSYGLDVVLNRLRAMDLWRNDTFVEQWISQMEKDSEGRDRKFRGGVEDFFYEHHSKFKNDFKDINTANLNKNYKRR